MRNVLRKTSNRSLPKNRAWAVYSGPANPLL
jgi:hypothetical protein